jgi:hypothetical protein
MLLHLAGVLEHLRPVWELPPAPPPFELPERGRLSINEPKQPDKTKYKTEIYGTIQILGSLSRQFS